MGRQWKGQDIGRGQGGEKGKGRESSSSLFGMHHISA